jgi:hypothetical protein
VPASSSVDDDQCDADRHHGNLQAGYANTCDQHDGSHEREHDSNPDEGRHGSSLLVPKVPSSEGVASFTEWRRQYPAEVRYRVRRITAREDLAVVAPWRSDTPADSPE